VTFKGLRRLQLSNAAKKCFEVHGESIRNKNKGMVPWNKGMKGVYSSVPCSEEKKVKISKANSGERNGMYGTKYTDEDKYNMSVKMKQNILDGKFTPKTNNRNTHFYTVLDGNTYKSSWEAIYKYFNPLCEYEKLRLKYFDTVENTERVYIVDFVDNLNKILVEVKPKIFFETQNVKDKLISLYEYAASYDYAVVLVDENYLIQYDYYQIDKERFDSKTYKKITKFYETYKKN